MHPTGRGVSGIFANTVLAIAFAWALTNPAQGQLVVVNDTFTGTTLSSGWQVGGTGYSPTLTAATGVDTSGSGWLRMTDTGGNEATYAVDTNSFNGTNATIAVKFNYAAYNGTGADGITFFLADASKTFGVGAYGGSLGYAQKTGINGLNGGYIGLGIDEFGNYSNPTEGRVGGTGFIPGNVSIRGPGNGTSGYDYLGGTTALADPIAFPTYTTRPTGVDLRTFEIVITATNQLTVYMQSGTAGSMQALYSIDLSGYARPDDLIMGFTAGTGGSTDIHEIQGLSLASQAATLWTHAGGNTTWATGGNWNGSGTVPAVGADILLDNHYVSTAQTIDVGAGSTRVIRSMQIDAPFGYTLNNGTLEFADQGILGPSGIFVSQGHGAAAHSINSNLVADNAIEIRNGSSANLALTGTLVTNGNAIRLSGTGNTSMSGVISGGGAITKADGGNVTLSGNNTYSGGTTLEAGTLTVGHNSALGSGDVTINGGTLASNASNTVANNIALQGDAGFSNITTSGTVTQTGADTTLTMLNANQSGVLNLSNNNTGRTLTVEVDSGTSTISGVVQNGGTGAGNLTKTGTGTLTLSGTNTYTGTTTISNGTLKLGGNDVLADASGMTIGASGVLNLDGKSDKVGTLTATGGAMIDFGSTSGANSLVFGTYVAPASGVLIVKNWESALDKFATTVAGQNVNSIYISGIGTVAEDATTSTVGSYGSAYLIKQATQSWKTWLGGSTAWATSGNWSPSGAPNSVGALALFTGTTASATANLSANRTLTGLRFDSTAKSYTLANGSGNRTLTMDSPSTGGIAYIQQQSSSNQTLSMGTLRLNDNTVLDVTGTGNLTVNSLLTGAGNLVKDGTGNGKLVLAGNSSAYAANIFINTGTVQITNAGSLGTTAGTTTIADGGALEIANNITSAESISVSGQGVSNGGAIRNVSGNNTLSGNLTFTADSRINSDSGTLTLSGGLTTSNNALNFGGAGNITASGTLNAGIGNVTIDSTGTVTFSGGSANTMGATAVNSGTLLLNTTAGIDAVSGNLTIGDGVGTGSSATVKLNAANQIDDAAAVTINSDGLLNLNGHAETISTFGGSGTIDNTSATAATLTFGDTTSTTFTGVIQDTSGNLTLVKQGTGKITLTGANSYAGGTSLNAGIIAVQTNNTALGTGAVTVASGANLEVAGGVTLANAMNLNGPGTLANDGAVQATAGSNTLSGAITLQTDSRLMADSGSTLTVTNTISGTGKGLTLGGSGNISITGNITTGTAGSLTKDGDGYATLSGTNTFTGATTVSAGTLEIRSASALGTTAGGASVADGATLALSNSISTAETPLTLNGQGVGGNGALRSLSGTNTVSGAIALGSDTTVGVDAGTLTASGVISGAATDLNKVGSGTLTLSGGSANTFSGNLNVNDGTVILSKSAGVNASGTGGVTIGDGVGSANSAVVQLNAANQISSSAAVALDTDGKLNLNSNSQTIGSLAGSGSVVLGTGNTLTVGNSTSTTFTGSLTTTGTGAVTKTGTGTLIIGGTDGSNSFAAAKINLNQGTVQLGANNILSTALNFNGGTFSVNGFNDTVASATLTASSVLDFNSVAGVFDFTNGIYSGGTLTINNWAGSVNGGGASQLLLGGTVTGSLLANINFAGYGAGAQIVNGEIVPITGTSYSWNVNSDGNWSSNANWNPSTGNPNGIGQSANFGSAITANHVVNLDAARTIGYLNFNDDNNYTISSATNRLTFAVSSGSAQMNVSNTGSDTISAGINLSNNLVINQNSTGTLTLSNANAITGTAKNLTVGGSGDTVISGIIATTSGSLTKNNAGTLTLSGANTYTGGTTINDGTIAVSADNNLGASGALTLNGGTLENTGAFTLNAARTVTVSGGGGTFQTDANLIYNGALAGAGAITKTGSGTLTSGGAGANTQSGSLTVNAGAYEIAKSAAVSGIGDASAVTVASGATLKLNGTGGYVAETIGSLSGAGTVTNASANALALTAGGDNTSTTFSGALQNTGGALALTKTGTGTMTLTDTAGTSNYTGTTTVSAGVLNIQSNTALGSTAGGTSVSSGAALQVQGNIAVGAEALALNGTGIANDGALRNISGNNSMAGNIALSGTTTKIQSDAGTLTLSGAVSGAAQNLVLDGAGNITMSGAIGTTTGTLTKNGSGYDILSGNSTYTGATAINNGTLEIRSNTALGTSAGGATVASGATLALSNNITSAETPLTLNGAGDGSGGALRSLSGTNTLSGAVSLATSSLVGVDSGTLTMSGVVSGTATGLTKVGSGTLVLSNSNTYTGGTSINAGTLQANSDIALGAAPATATAGNITLNGGTLATNYAGAINTNRGVALGAAGGTIDTMGQAVSYAGVMAGTGSFTKAGTGTLTLTGANTYSGATNLNGGTLSINSDARLGTAPGSATANQISFNGGTLATTATMTLDSNRSMTVNAGGGGINVANATTLTFGGTIAGTGALSLALNSTGVLALSSNVDLSSGTLLLSGGTLSLGGSNISVGTFHITGNTILDFGSSSAATINASNFIVDAGVTVTVNNWANGVDYFFANNSFLQNGGPNAVLGGRGVAPENQIVFSGFTGNSTVWNYYDSGHNQITPVPEPRTYGAIFLGACVLFLGWIRWRRRSATA